MKTIIVKLAILGDGVHEYNVPEGTTVAQLKEIADINPHLQFRIGGEMTTDETVIPNPEVEGEATTVVATKNVGHAA